MAQRGEDAFGVLVLEDAEHADETCEVEVAIQCHNPHGAKALGAALDR